MATPLSSNLEWDDAKNKWAQSLNPVLANSILSGNIVQNQRLIAGANIINHGLGRVLQGWFITDQNGVATIYRSQPMNASTLTLTSSAIVTCSLWVF